MNTLHDFSASTLDGKPLPLSTLAGKLVLVVNTFTSFHFLYQYLRNLILMYAFLHVLITVDLLLLLTYY